MDVMMLADEIIGGKRLTEKEECMDLITADLDQLTRAADKIREKLTGNKADLCAIISGRLGHCPENCKFCSQSAYNHTGIDHHPFLDVDSILEDCDKYEKMGVDRYSIVTAGRLCEGEDLEKSLEAYSALHKRFPNMILCASQGLMTSEAYRRMKKAGVSMVHMNIETSKKYFPNVCTSHSYEEKLEAIGRAKEAGLDICCGGIIGMGETFEDRIEMALTIAGLHVQSIPLNALVPIKGTPFENMPLLSNEDFLRTVAIFRFINPDSVIRIAAGRYRFENAGAALFKAGANATITGHMLTTKGTGTEEDRKMLEDLHYKLHEAKEQ